MSDRRLNKLASRLRRKALGSKNGDRPAAAAAVEASPEAEAGEDWLTKNFGQWFHDHYEVAARETIEFFHGAGISLEDAVVADVGAGEGITDLGIVHKASPARLVGFDINETSIDHLLEQAQKSGVAQSLPTELEFVLSQPERIPAQDDTFDAVVTWSAFEHVMNPVAVLKEIRRILKPTGSMFLQLWPFYYSQHGSHLNPWYPDGFAQLRFPDEEIERTLRDDPEYDEFWNEMLLDAYKNTLNGLTLDQLHTCLRQAGLRVTRLEILSHAVNLPNGVDDWPLSALGIAGVKLIAVPAEPRSTALRSTDSASAPST